MHNNVANQTRSNKKVKAQKQTSIKLTHKFVDEVKTL